MSARTKTDSITNSITKWLGTPVSIWTHTVFFATMFILPFFGWPLQQMLLVLTTVLSIEAIYLALFIQMSVNKASESLEEVEESLEEVEEDIDDIERDIDTIQEDEKKDDMIDRRMAETLRQLDQRIEKLHENIEVLTKANRKK